jgi:Mrp family chromosome partitioning ATPase/uncharacterized protein involved in exopolysaccharide biosynthesis
VIYTEPWVAPPPLVGPPPEEPAGQSLWSLVDDRLRGRWKWAILTALLLAPAFGYAGWESTVPQFESVGVIRVASTVPITFEGIPEGEVGNFTMFLNTQVERLRSRRVIENAMEDEDLLRQPWVKRPGATRELDRELEVTGDRNSELIWVRYESESPVLAQAIVNAVIRSYDEIYGQADGTTINRKLEDLQLMEAQFQRELNRVRADIGTIIDRHEIDPAQLQEMNILQLEQVELQIFAAERALRNSLMDSGGDGPDELTSPQILAQLEQLDPELAIRRQTRDLKRARFEEIARHYRPAASIYRIALRDTDTAERLFQQQYRFALAQFEQSRLGPMTATATGGDYGGWPVAPLQEEISTLRERRDAILDENQALHDDIQLLRDRREQEDLVKSNLERTRQRIQGLLREEKNVANRISIEQEGFRPREPSSDRRPRRAAAGVLAGCAASFGLFFLLGTVDRRAFGLDQLRHVGDAAALPVLGVLPDLGAGTVDPESSEVASHCVHQIRNQVEARRDGERGFVLMISSPFQGDGKTSIALCLGWSYAQAGYRTLLVDCDLVGRSLSRQLGMVGHDGLKEALRAGSGEGCIGSLAVSDLDVLPVGRDESFGPEAIRRDRLERIFDEVRGQYDVVVVDTGPLLGSLESTPAAAAADGVVLSVRRGRSRSRLEECVGRLAGVGARCLGIVLNCATRADCYRSVSDASMTHPEHQPPEARAAGETVLVRTPGGARSPLVAAMERMTRD